jgi:hypothetical protein
MATTTESVRIGRKKDLERVYARAYLGSNQDNLTNGNWTKINLNTLDKDLGGNFDTATGKFIVPVTGLYIIIINVQFTGVVTDSRYAIAIYNNASSIRENSAHSSNTNDLSMSIVHEVFLRANDEVELYAQSNSGDNTVDVLAGSKYTSLSARLVTKEGTRQ